MTFARALVKARRDLGFESGHAFYAARGGRRGLGMLYANYMALERGTSLPKPFRLEAILRALGLPEPSQARRALVYAYLTSLLGGDALLRELEPAPAQSALSSEEVAKEALRRRAAHLDLEQWRALASDDAAYYAHVYLINTPGWATEAEVAAAIRSTPARAKAALRRLAAARIVELKGGRARSPLNYRYLHPLPSLRPTLSLKAAILKKREAFAGERGTLERRVTVNSRMSKAQVARYFERLTDTVKLAGVYGDADKAPDTDVFFVDARMYRIFD